MAKTSFPFIFFIFVIETLAVNFVQILPKQFQCILRCFVCTVIKMHPNGQKISINIQVKESDTNRGCINNILLLLIPWHLLFRVVTLFTFKIVTSEIKTKIFADSLRWPHPAHLHKGQLRSLAYFKFNVLSLTKSNKPTLLNARKIRKIKFRPFCTHGLRSGSVKLISPDFNGLT